MIELILFVVVAGAALFIGLFIYQRPQKAFELQKKFYALINWRIEPISMEKEIRNTKIMGLFLIVFTLVSCVYYWVRFL